MRSPFYPSYGGAGFTKLQFCRPIVVLDVSVKIDPVRPSLHEGIKDVLRNSVVLVNGAGVKLDLQGRRFQIVTD